jgi:hypothetical protein
MIPRIRSPMAKYCPEEIRLVKKINLIRIHMIYKLIIIIFYVKMYNRYGKVGEDHISPSRPQITSP